MRRIRTEISPISVDIFRTRGYGLLLLWGALFLRSFSSLCRQLLSPCPDLAVPPSCQSSQKKRIPSEASSASESLPRPALAKEKFSPGSARKHAPPSFSLASCLHPSRLAQSIRLNVQKTCSLLEPAGDRNGSFPVALPTEKRSFLPAVCRRKGSLRDQPSCLRASVFRHLLGQ